MIRSSIKIGKSRKSSYLDGPGTRCRSDCRSVTLWTNKPLKRR